MAFPSEIKALITEYRDEPQIRISDNKLTVCASSPLLNGNYKFPLSLRNGLYLLTQGPIVYNVTIRYRCLIIHLAHYDISTLPALNLDRATNDTAFYTPTVGSITLISGAEQRLSIDLMDGKDALDALQPQPHLLTEVHQNDFCVVLLIAYYDMWAHTIRLAFTNLAYEQFTLAMNNFMQDKPLKPRHNISFATDNVRKYFPIVPPDIAVQANRIYVYPDGRVDIKMSNKALLRLTIDNGNEEIKYLYSLLRRARQTSNGDNMSNITPYPYMQSLQERIVNDARYLSGRRIKLTIRPDWNDYLIEDKH